jgi:ParB/RepB/Spo0J family partition protein
MMATVVHSKDKMKMVKLADINVNGRYRSDMGNIEELADAIREKGVIQPITVDTNLNLLAGGRRHMASTLAGLIEIPALIRNIEGELDAREIELMENVHRKEFTWQEEARLTAEINRLYEEKHSKTRDWSGRKTAELLDQSPSRAARNIKLAKAIEAIPEIASCKTADDALKTLRSLEERAITEELRARQQKRIEVAEHHAAPSSDAERVARGINSMLKVADANYMICDVFKGMAGLKKDGNIQFIECDPPYGVDLQNQKSKLNATPAAKDMHEEYNEIPEDQYLSFLDKLTKELYRIAGKDCWMVFWFGQSWQHEVLTSLRTAGWQVDEIPAIWVKFNGQTLQPELYLARAWEPFYICRKGNPVLAKRGRLNTFLVPGCPTAGNSLDKKYHPTQRPLELIQDILSTLCIEGQNIFVPFLGSGATLRACYNLGYNGFGFDNNDAYKDKFMLAVEADTHNMLTKKGE